MWNWLVSSLAMKASILLFDGFPMYKKNDLLIEIADTEDVTLFGVSAKYIDALRKSRSTPINKFNLCIIHFDRLQCTRLTIKF